MCASARSICRSIPKQFSSRERAHAYANTYARMREGDNSPRVARVNPTGCLKPPWVKGALSARYPKRGNSVWLGGPRCRQVRGPPAAPHQVISYDVPSSQGGAEAHGDAPQPSHAYALARNANRCAIERMHMRMHMRTHVHIGACICAHTYAHAYAPTRMHMRDGFDPCPGFKISNTPPLSRNFVRV